MASILPGTRLVVPLHAVSYDFYQQVRRAPGNRRLRMTYHDGTLEIGLITRLARHHLVSRCWDQARRPGPTAPGAGEWLASPPGSASGPG